MLKSCYLIIKTDNDYLPFSLVAIISSLYREFGLLVLFKKDEMNRIGVTADDYELIFMLDEVMNRDISFFDSNLIHKVLFNFSRQQLKYIVVGEMVREAQ